MNRLYTFVELTWLRQIFSKNLVVFLWLSFYLQGDPHQNLLIQMAITLKHEFLTQNSWMQDPK